MAVRGGCLCGAVRYEAKGQPLATRMCFCRLCQYIAAGNATVNTCFRAEDVTFTGTLKDYVSTADSGNEMHRGFCPECGVHVTSTAASRPGLVFVRVGTLDDPGLVRPAAAIWTSAAPGWACIDPSIPQNPGQPPPVAG